VGARAACADSTRASSRESVFWRCARSEVDPRFPKYPRLPVLACAGYEQGEPEDEGEV
jgi:hypothetical protein